MHKDNLTKSQITVAIFGFQLSTQRTICADLETIHIYVPIAVIYEIVCHEEKRSQKKKKKKTTTTVKLFWRSNFDFAFIYKEIAKILRIWKLSHRSKMMITLTKTVTVAVTVVVEVMLMMMTQAFGKDFVPKNFSNNVDLMGRTTM